MSDQYVGEIRAVGFNFAPEGWMFCDGSLYQISQYEILFALIGTSYGGDGQNTFAVPDLRSRVPLGSGSGPGLSSYVIGQTVGTENVTLTANTTAPHSHLFIAISDAVATGNPSGALPAATSGTSTLYSDKPPTTTLASAAVAPFGSSLPHVNVEPCQAQNFIIAFTGIFPSSS